MKNMTKMILIIIAFLTCTVSPFVRADYPIMSQHYAADPTAVEWDSRLYVYCSNDEENTEDSGYIMDSIVCFSTNDLKNWTDHGVVFDADELSSWYSGTAWAPCIVKNHNQLYLYFGDAYWGIGVVTSTSPTGPFTAPKNDLVVKRDSISGGTPGANSTWLFDPGVFVDDDDTVHMYFGGEGANQARYIELNSNMYDAIGSAVPINFPDFFEASHMHKYNGVYYYSYADNYYSDYTNPTPTPGSQIAYMTSNSPAGPFTYQGVALGPPPDNYGNNNHHTFFTYQGQWYCVYHNRYQATQDGVSTTEHRNICLDRLYYNQDGTIQKVIPTANGLTQLKSLDPFVRVEAETIAKQSGIETESCSEGGMNVTSIENGDWILVRGVDFGTDANSFGAQVASENYSGSIELRLDSLNGTVIGTCFVPNTGGVQKWTMAYCSINEASGVHDLYLKFKGGRESNVFNINWWQLNIYSNTTFENIEIDASETHQTIEGMGGAICFYNGWFTAHPYKDEIFDLAFSGLNLSMLRIGNWWRGVDGEDTAIYEIVEAANQSLGHSVPILISSWSPPAYLKSNGEVANGGTLIKKNGYYDYEGFADYWHDSIQDYIAHGVTPTWIGIQNEPDWTADYDSCRFDPTEGQYASFGLAQDAVYQKLQINMISPPKLLGPECVGLWGNAAGLKNYMSNMNADTFYGIAHHLYGGSTDGTPDGYNPAFNTVLNTTNTLFPDKPIFMTEFGDIGGLISCANLIHNSLAIEQVSGYNHWSLMWPGEIGLIEIEFPWGSGDWTNPKGYWLNPSYWSMKHYSYFIQPGYIRVTTNSSNTDLLTSSYLSPDNNRMVTVIINRSKESPAVVTFDVNDFDYAYSHIYQSTETNHFESLGSLHSSQFTAAVSSITTIVLDKEVVVGQAGNPSPVDGAAEIPSNITLSWTPGANATSHAVYLGTDCNTVALATPSSPEYQGTVTTSSFITSGLSSNTTYYWSVDEIAYSSVSPGQVWSFSTEPAAMHTHLKFDEGRGTFASDSTGNNWNGTLVNDAKWISGKFGNAVDLDGSNDYISLPAGVVDGLTNFTISTWINIDSSSDWTRVFDFGNNTDVYMCLTPQSGGNGPIRFTIKNGDIRDQIDGSTAIPTNIWSHIAVTYNGGTGILYVDGTEVGRNSNMTLNPDSLGITTQNYIGKSQYSDPYLDGLVDDFRIYENALGASEIANISQAISD
ncbi:MAG: carbohydrate-binding protein [Sedimentisphaerales bacterium]|nr:carbohydrate-binding protein [Sedimentisphaerales bacterium]